MYIKVDSFNGGASHDLYLITDDIVLLEEKGLTETNTTNFIDNLIEKYSSLENSFIVENYYKEGKGSKKLNVTKIEVKDYKEL